jgi:PAS domain S-box-containing protein
VLEVRGGNLSYRVGVKAIDELALLVRAFNDMTQALEVNGRELERRRRFTEAILENVPAGVISLSADGRILLTNRALGSIFAPESLNEAAWLEDLFPRDDAAEIRYLMNRARRTGIASRQFELERDGQTLHLAVTVSALEGKENAGYVLVIEDTSELLRAQRASAWQEVARRIAHEIKNPLTPIALSAERITRTLERQPQKPEAGPSAAVLRECAALIVKEVQSLRTLVDEFAQFSRFPAAQPRPVSLNDVVREGLAVFESRLEEIEVVTDLAPDLPPLPLDPDQIKRVVVNLVDNAAEAMRDQPLRRLWITTQAVTLDSVELCVADTGCGVSAEDRERLFLPYFSTKGRGTGLGLAIVSHILAEHGALIRVEDNEPAGARFVIEFAAPVAEESPVAAS